MDIASLGIVVDSKGVLRATKNLDKLEKKATKTEKATSNLKRAFAGLGAAATVRQLVNMTDSFTGMTNKLKVVTTSTEQLVRVQGKLLQVANSTRSSLDSTVGLYTVLARNTEALNLSQSRLLRITETINKSFATSGASAQEASGAIRQLSQGLAAGALRGDEFNSVAEGAPEILRAISKETGMATGELREFAATGGITAELLIKSLEGYSEVVDGIFNKSTATMAQSLEQSNNNAIAFVGSMGALNSATQSAGRGIVTLSENLDTVLSIGQLIAVVYGAKVGGAMLTSAGAFTINTIAAASNATAVTATGFAARAGALGYNVLTASLVAATAAFGRFTTMMGPVGLAILAASAGLYAYTKINEDTESAVKKTTKAEKEAVVVKEKISKEDQKLLENLRRELKQLNMLEVDIAVSNNLRKLNASAISDQGKEVVALTRAIFTEQEALDLAAEKATEAQQKFDDMANGMSTSFKATFREMLDGGDNVFRNLVDSAKAMVKDILSEMALLAAKPFIMRIAGVATMGASGMANAGMGSDGGGGMDMLSNLSNLSSLSGNSIGQGFVSAGNFMASGSTSSAAYAANGGAFTGAGAVSNLVYTGVALVAGLIGQELFGKNGGAGASIGATIGMAAGGLPGALVGGLIGGALGGMIGPDKPSQRFAISTGSNVAGHTGNLPMDEAIAKYGNQSDPDGSNFAFTDTAFGKTFLNSRRVDLTGMQKMIQGADDAMASFLDSDEIAAIKDTLDNAEHFASGKHNGNKGGPQFNAIFNRYRMVLGAIDEELVGMFDARATKDNIGKLPVALAAINKDLKDQIGIFSGTFGSDSGVLGQTIQDAVALVDTYATENETLLDTYSRLSVETLSLTSSLDIMGITLNKSVDGMISFARELSEAAGGAETASALWRGYFSTFYTDQEKAIASLEEGTAKLNAFLKATELDGLGLSMQNFRASFEQALSAGLSASQTVDWLAAGELIRQVEELANTGMTGKISTLVTAKNNLIDAYKREIESQEGLASSFRGLADGLRASAQGLLLSSLSPLTNAERFAAAEARFNNVNNRAQLGDADALADLATVSEEFLKESQKFNASGTAYTDDFNMVQTALTEAGTASNRIADNADRMVDQLKAEFNLIATSNHWLETINTSVLSLEQALDKFVLEGGNGTAAGKANGSQSVAMSNAQFVDQLYTQGFGRQADIGGANYWNESLRNGATRQQIVDNFVSSAEAANVGFDQTNIKMFAKGGISNRPAIFGEAGPEAAVPLPDGRSIPVTLDKSIEQAIERMAIRVVAAVQGTTQAVNDSSNDAQSSANRVQAVR